MLYAGYTEIKQTERIERKCPECILINKFMVAQTRVLGLEGKYIRDY